MRPLFLLLVALLLANEAAAERRVALVIGNSSYRESPLRNPANDARAMAERLKSLGFRVIARENTTKLEMERAVADFGDALRGGDAVGLFFYAGHGMQVQGKNYLLPIDAQIAAETRVRLEALDLDAVLDEMAASETRVNLVILDACRNNPFERRFRAGGGAGLAQVNAPQGTLIAYATAPGKTAADGTGANGLYTSKLLDALGTPALPVEEVFKKVRVEVSKASANGQTPWESSSLTGSFYFTPPAAAAAPPPPQPSAAPVADKEVVFWQSIQESRDPALFESYLARYPQGTFAGIAEAKLRALRQPVAAAAAPAALAAPVAPARHPFDGTWVGTLECGPNSRMGWGPVSLNNRPMTVSEGRISSRNRFKRPDGAPSEDRMQGAITADGRVTIEGEVGFVDQPGGNPIAMRGQIRDGQLVAEGIYSNRECRMHYRRQ